MCKITKEKECIPGFTKAYVTLLHKKSISEKRTFSLTPSMKAHINLSSCFNFSSCSVFFSCKERAVKINYFRHTGVWHEKSYESTFDVICFFFSFSWRCHSKIGVKSQSSNFLIICFLPRIFLQSLKKLLINVSLDAYSVSFITANMVATCNIES